MFKRRFKIWLSLITLKKIKYDDQGRIGDPLGLVKKTRKYLKGRWTGKQRFFEVLVQKARRQHSGQTSKESELWYSHNSGRKMSTILGNLIQIH